MNLTSNQANQEGIDIQAEALRKTLDYYGDTSSA